MSTYEDIKELRKNKREELISLTNSEDNPDRLVSIISVSLKKPFDSELIDMALSAFLAISDKCDFNNWMHSMSHFITNLWKLRNENDDQYEFFQNWLVRFYQFGFEKSYEEYHYDMMCRLVNYFNDHAKWNDIPKTFLLTEENLTKCNEGGYELCDIERTAKFPFDSEKDLIILNATEELERGCFFQKYSNNGLVEIDRIRELIAILVNNQIDASQYSVECYINQAIKEVEKDLSKIDGYDWEQSRKDERKTEFGNIIKGLQKQLEDVSREKTMDDEEKSIFVIYRDNDLFRKYVPELLKKLPAMKPFVIPADTDPKDMATELKDAVDKCRDKIKLIVNDGTCENCIKKFGFSWKNMINLDWLFSNQVEDWLEGNTVTQNLQFFVKQVVQKRTIKKIVVVVEAIQDHCLIGQDDNFIQLNNPNCSACAEKIADDLLPVFPDSKTIIKGELVDAMEFSSDPETLLVMDRHCGIKEIMSRDGEWYNSFSNWHHKAALYLLPFETCIKQLIDRTDVNIDFGFDIEAMNQVIMEKLSNQIIMG